MQTSPNKPPQATNPSTPPHAKVESVLSAIMRKGDTVRRILHREDFHKYQEKGVSHLLSVPFANLWLFMGAGKTVIVLTAFIMMRRMGLVKRMLVVAPKRVCELTWDDECTKWSHLINERITFSKMLGSEKKKRQALFTDADIYLVNYESLSWLISDLKHYYINQGIELPFDMIVWDEVSKMKNKTSIRFKEMTHAPKLNEFPLLSYFKRRIGLTASPASNGLDNTWAQSYVTDLGQRLGVSYDQFLSKYFQNVGGQYGSKWVPWSEDETRNMIVRALHDNTLIIPAEGNLDIPPLYEQVIQVALPPAKMKEYINLETKFFAEMDDGKTIDVFNEASLASKLLQFANGIVYTYPDPTNPDYREEVSVHTKKFEAFRDIYDSTGEEPIFLVYNFTSELNKLKKMYPDARVLVSCSEAEAIEIRDLFNAGKLKLVITHAQSAGYGVNLQGACSIVVWFGLPYNQEHYEQTIGRIWRQGQTKPVRLMLLLAKGTRDFVVRDTLSDKTNAQNKLKNALLVFREKLGL